MKKLLVLSLAAGTVACGHAHRESAQDEAAESGVSHDARLPLSLVRDLELPGRPNRFDYQDIDTTRARLFIAHMHDASVVAVAHPRALPASSRGFRRHAASSSPQSYGACS